MRTSLRSSIVCIFMSLLFGSVSFAAEPLHFAVIGDSLSDEYPSSWKALNWVQILAAKRVDSIYFGKTGQWGEPRRNGFQFNWARGGATSSDALFQLKQFVGSGHSIDFVVVAVGGNDFAKGVYAELYHGKDPEPIVDNLVGNITAILSEIRKTSSQRSDTKIILANLFDWGRSPLVRAFLDDAKKRSRVTCVITKANQRIASIAAEREVPVIDLFGFAELRAADVVVGGVGMLPGCGGGPKVLLTRDGVHPATVGQALIGNMIIYAANTAYGVNIEPLTDQEILQFAGISQTESEEEPTYFSVSKFVVICE